MKNDIDDDFKDVDNENDSNILKILLIVFTIALFGIAIYILFFKYGSL